MPVFYSLWILNFPVLFVRMALWLIFTMYVLVFPVGVGRAPMFEILLYASINIFISVVIIDYIILIFNLRKSTCCPLKVWLR